MKVDKKSKKRETWLFNEKGKFLVMEKGIKKEKEPGGKRTNPLTWLFKENPCYVMAFFIPAVILLVSYLIFGVYPVSGRSVLSLDLNGQYVYYFDYVHDVFAGNESIFYSWSRNLSGEFLGIIGYYLASPFNLLVWVFPRAHITEGLLTMLVVKTGAIGVCSAVYFKRGRGLSDGTAVIFSMMYALCSYTIVQTMNPMWLDGIMALPLVIYGVESLVRHGRFRMLVIALVYSFVTCFYIGYMIGIFTVLYFIYCLFAVRRAETFGAGDVAARTGVFMVAGAAAVLISAFMLVPVYNSLELGKFTFSVPDYSLRTNFNLLDTGRKLFPNSYDTVRNEGFPFIYSGIVTVVLLPLYFFGGKKKTASLRKRAAGGILALVLVLCMYITPVDMLWHGGQLPNWLPYRYSFILVFLFVSWSAEVFDRLGDYSRRAIAGSALAFFALALYIEGRDTFSPTLGDSGRELFDGITVMLPALLILIIVLLILVNKGAKRMKGAAFFITAGIIVGAELLYNTTASIEKQHTDITYSTRGSYVDFIVPVREKVDEIKAADEGFYRIEKDFFRTVNDPMALGMYGLSHSSSTLNEKAITFLGKLGLTSKSHYTRYSGATPVIDDLLGVKYILSCSGNESTRITAKGDIFVESNADAMPMAYLTDSGIKQLRFDNFPGDDNNVFKRQNRLMSAMIGESEPVDYFRYLNVIKETENVSEGTATGGHQSYRVIETGKNAQVKYTMTAEVDGEIFLWLPTDYERRLNVWVNRGPDNEWKGNFFEFDDFCVKSLGEFKEGENFSVTLTLTRDDLYYKEAYFAYIDEPVYQNAIQKLHEINMNTAVTKKSPTDILIQTSSSSDMTLFTSIPAEPGWTAAIDGKEVGYTELLDALIGLNVPAGAHSIELKFTPAGYPAALYISGGGILIFALLCLLYSKLSKENGAPELSYGYTPDEFFSEYVEYIGEYGEDANFGKENELAESEHSDYTDNTEDGGNSEYDGEMNNLVLGKDESFASIINDFNEINAPVSDDTEALETSDYAFFTEENAIIPDVSVVPVFPQAPEEISVRRSNSESAEDPVALEEIILPEITAEFESLIEPAAEESVIEPSSETIGEPVIETETASVAEPKAENIPESITENIPEDYIEPDSELLQPEIPVGEAVIELPQPEALSEEAKPDAERKKLPKFSPHPLPFDYAVRRKALEMELMALKDVENAAFGYGNASLTIPQNENEYTYEHVPQSEFAYQEPPQSAPKQDLIYEHHARTEHADASLRYDYVENTRVFNKEDAGYGQFEFIAEEQEELVETYDEFVSGNHSARPEALAARPNEADIWNGAHSAQDLFPDEEITRRTIDTNKNKEKKRPPYNPQRPSSL